MARGINKVILVGHLGRDPESKVMPNGNAICNIAIATSESWRDKQTGQQQERTEWHRVVIFGKLAEIAGQYLRKGSLVYIEGQLQTRKWQDQSGQDRYSTEVVVSMNGSLQMLDRKGAGENDGMSQDYQGQSGQSPQYNQNQPQQYNQNQSAPKSNQAPQPTFDDFDDDIPF